MSESTAHVLNQEYLQPVLASYPHIPQEPEKIQVIQLGQASEAVSLTLGGQPYLFKRLPAGAPQDRQKYSAALQSALTEQGFSCPGLVLNQEGEGVTLHNGRLHTLQTWVDGHHADTEKRNNPGLETCQDLGRLLGRMHSILQVAALPEAPEAARHPVDQIFQSTSSAVEMLFRGRLLRPSFYWKLKIRAHKTPMDKTLIKALSQCRKANDHLQDWFADHQQLLGPMVPTHGDINWENLMLRPDGQLVLLDFDNARQQPLFCESAAAVAVLCPDDDEQRQAFAEGYQAEGLPFPARDILENLILLKYVRSLVWQLPYWYRDKEEKEEIRMWLLFLAKGLDKSWKKLSRR